MDVLQPVALAGWVSVDDMKARTGEAIKKRRVELQLTQEQVAFEAGISVTYLSEVERGRRNLALINLFKLSKALDTSLGELFSGAGL